MLGDEHVDDLAVLVHGPVHLPPDAVDLDGGLGGEPAVTPGGAVTGSLAREGASVAIADISTEALEATRATLADSRVESLVWDLVDPTVIDARVSAVELALGGGDILINITGGPPPTPVAAQPLDVWTRHFQSMALSVIGITDRVLPGMSERGWGRIVTSTSSGAIAPIPNLGISNTLRASLFTWNKTLSNEVGSSGITSNIVVAGRVATRRIVALDEAKAAREGSSVEAVADASAATIALGRYGDPREFADVVNFLASERARYVSGSVIRIDGGYIPSV